MVVHKAPNATMEWFGVKSLARLVYQRARKGIFILEDVRTKQALIQHGIGVKRIAAEREVVISLPAQWSLYAIGNNLHVGYNDKLEPVFECTFPSHLSDG